MKAVGICDVACELDAPYDVLCVCDVELGQVVGIAADPEPGISPAHVHVQGRRRIAEGAVADGRVPRTVENAIVGGVCDGRDAVDPVRGRAGAGAPYGALPTSVRCSRP